MSDVLRQLAEARVRALEEIAGKHRRKLWHDHQSESIGDELAVMYAEGQASCGLSSGDIARAIGLRPEKVQRAMKLGRALQRTSFAASTTEGGPTPATISPLHSSDNDPSSSGRTYGEAGRHNQEARLATQPGATA